MRQVLLGIYIPLWLWAGNAAAEQISVDHEGALARCKLTYEQFAKDHAIAAAREGYRKAVASDPSYAMTYYLLAGLDEGEQNWSGAVLNYEKFVTIDQRSFESAKAERRLNELRQVIEGEKTAEGKRYRDYGEAIAQIKKLVDEQKEAEAVATVKRALELDPRRWEAYLLYSSICMKRGWYEESSAALSKAQLLAPPGLKSIADDLLQKSEIRRKATDFNMGKGVDVSVAAEKFAKAFELAPEREDLGFQAAWAYQQCGANKACLALLRKLVQSKNPKMAKAATEQLERTEQMARELDKELSETTAGKDAAELGNTAANFYQQGDCRRSFWCYKRAAEQGACFAQLSLAGLYLTGQGTDKDETEAARWYRKAADQGAAEAQCNLALMYLSGKGVVQDHAQAATWFRKAAEQGVAQAQCNLGDMLGKGQALTQDQTQAAKWLRRAAEQGYAPAQVKLGARCLNGNGVDRDSTEAARWYRKAAEQGDAAGQTSLGLAYANGFGVEKDDNEAIRWFSKAAAQGDKMALQELQERGIEPPSQLQK